MNHILVMGIKNGTNVSFSVQSNILPEVKAQILQMRYQNVQGLLGFTEERKKICNIQFIIMFLSVKNCNFFFQFFKHILNSLFSILKS